MPISGPLLGQQIFSMFTASGFTGSMSFTTAQAIGNGIINSILATGVYQGVSTGLGLGVGVSVGTPPTTLTGGIVMPSIVSNLILLNMTAQGLAGSKTQSMAYAIGNAVSSHMLTAAIQGASTVVAAGVGVGSIVGVIGPTMGLTISLQMLAAGLTGTAVKQLANAIGYGISTALSATVVNTIITGVPVGPVPPAFPPIPCVGTDTGKIF
jgi:hypothetical protein